MLCLLPAFMYILYVVYVQLENLFVWIWVNEHHTLQKKNLNEGKELYSCGNGRSLTNTLGVLYAQEEVECVHQKFEASCQKCSHIMQNSDKI